MLPGRNLFSGLRNRPIWTPADFDSSLIVWLNAGRSTHTLGVTPRAYGTTPPVLTFAGTRTGGVYPYIQCDGAGALGVWTYKVSYDDGATFPHTGILSSGSATALPGIGSAITVAAAAGNAVTNNIWKPCVDTVNDLSGNSNHGSKSVVTKQPLIRPGAFNGLVTWDHESGGAGKGLDTPSLTLGTFTLFEVLKMTAGANTYISVHNNDVGTHSMYDGIGPSLRVVRAGVTSGKNVSAAWISSGSPLISVCQTFGGTHATHLAYKNGVLQSTTNTAANDPGTSTVAGALHIGHWQDETSSSVVFPGLKREVVVLNRQVTDAEAMLLHQWAKYDSLLTS